VDRLPVEHPVVVGVPRGHAVLLRRGVKPLLVEVADCDQLRMLVLVDAGIVHRVRQRPGPDKSYAYDVHDALASATPFNGGSRLPLRRNPYCGLRISDWTLTVGRSQTHA